MPFLQVGADTALSISEWLQRDEAGEEMKMTLMTSMIDDPRNGLLVNGILHKVLDRCAAILQVWITCQQDFHLWLTSA